MYAADCFRADGRQFRTVCPVHILSLRRCPEQHFDGGNVPQNGLALSVLSIALENDEPVANSELVESTYPGVLQKLGQLLEMATAKPETEAS